MKNKNQCSIDPRVKDQYIYNPEKQAHAQTSIAEVMRQLYEFRAARGHNASPSYFRPVHPHEFKATR